MVGTIVHQLTRNLTEEQIKQAGFDAYFVDHTAGVYPASASGFPWSAASMQVKGDLIADLTEDLAADAANSQGQHFYPLIFSEAYRQIPNSHEGILGAGIHSSFAQRAF